MKQTNIEQLTFSQLSYQDYAVTQWNGEIAKQAEDQIAEEVPVALEYNGISHTVMMVTPQDLEAFAIGFSLSEGIIRQPQDIYAIHVEPQVNGISVQLEIASACFATLKEKRRSMTGRTGCGLCGSDSLANALRLPDEKNLIKKSNLKVDLRSIYKGLQSLKAGQSLQKITGATHASALMNQQGDLLLCQEDVGRHNALDKLIGKMQLSDNATIAQAAFIVTSSRASYEMVQKTIMADVSILVAVSAPTGLAIRVAKTYGLTLVGFARESRLVVYADGQGMIKEAG